MDMKVDAAEAATSAGGAPDASGASGASGSRYGKLPAQGQQRRPSKELVGPLESWSESAGHRESSFRKKRPTRSANLNDASHGGGGGGIGSASFVFARPDGSTPGSPSGAISSRLALPAQTSVLSEAAGRAQSSERRLPGSSLAAEAASVLISAGAIPSPRATATVPEDSPLE
jgi:hypothetical protein